MGLSLVESHHLDDFDHESEDCQQNWPYDVFGNQRKHMS